MKIKPFLNEGLFIETVPPLLFSCPFWQELSSCHEALRLLRAYPGRSTVLHILKCVKFLLPACVGTLSTLCAFIYYSYYKKIFARCQIFINQPDVVYFKDDY